MNARLQDALIVLTGACVVLASRVWATELGEQLANSLLTAGGLLLGASAFSTRRDARK